MFPGLPSKITSEFGIHSRVLSDHPRARHHSPFSGQTFLHSGPHTANLLNSPLHPACRCFPISRHRYSIHTVSSVGKLVYFDTSFSFPPHHHPGKYCSHFFLRVKYIKVSPPFKALCSLMCAFKRICANWKACDPLSMEKREKWLSYATLPTKETRRASLDWGKEPEHSPSLLVSLGQQVN